ncbi:MAG TPA: TonB-dependent receptor, partial [Flavobacterium sp.]|nr:TonB-dependent receptor [Flavobacterium sp.]
LYTISNVESPDINTFSSTGVLQNGFERRRSFAFFANVDLAYDDYLFINVTGRNDWTSVLDESNNNYFYPSAGLSFVPTKAFAGLENSEVLNYLKIAASWVRIGNNNVDEYDINTLYSPGFGYPFGSNNSFGQQSSNTFAFLRPEFYTTKDVTVNAEFFNSRLTLDVSVFRTDNKDLNTVISSSFASGLQTSNINIGKTQTNGIEIDLGFTPIRSKELGLTWTNRLSYASAVTDVLQVSDDSDEIVIAGANFATSGGIGIFATEGEEYPLIKGIGYQRDDQGRVIVDAATGMPLKTLEYIKLGKATPDYILGYNTAIEFKGFRLAAVMDYRTGHQFWSGTKQWLSWSGHLYDSAVNGRTGFIFPNSSIETSPGVYAANTNVVTGGTTYSSYLSYFQDEFAETAENFVIDATAFKVRELSLSYSFPSDALTRAGLTSLRVGVNARNPFMILPKENRDYNDPEQSRSAGNDIGLAATGQYPQTRTYGFSVNLTF